MVRQKHRRLQTVIRWFNGRTKFSLNWIRNNPLIVFAALWLFGMWSWSMQTDSLDLAGNKRQGLLIASVTMLVNVTVSLLILRQMLKLADHLVVLLGMLKAIILLVPLFAFTDFLIAWLLALLWAGPQGQLDSILPIGSAALLILRTPLIFASRLVGFFGLAGFMWTALYVLTKKNQRILALVPLAGLSVFALAGLLIFKVNNPAQFKATLVSETLTERVPVVRPTDQKLVLFPEYGLDEIDNTNLETRIQKKNSLPKTYFAGSTQVYKRNRKGHENRLLLGDTQVGITNAQNKYRLIPAGEDAPYIMQLGLRATGQVGTLEYFEFSKSVLKGSHQLHNYDLGDGVTLGLAVCSSIIAPQDYRHFTKSGATVLANSASLKPFGGSRLFAWIQQSMGRFMAVANNRYFLQSANSASAYAYDNNGKLLVQKYGITTVNTQFASIQKHTIYTLVGEWVVWLGASVTLAAAFYFHQTKN